ncbi:hypothetical protein CC80DRAFT_573121 [Byssothecium circinans]|uniref:Uncharacterized protein n=1 Tax=Byssothecium circinans TaxID=147558 RepID=A0A6A5TML7_9PLEO|nr:hypothetical protein CC80DRAFT_573121 [Byssothecium circinans]
MTTYYAYGTDGVLAERVDDAAVLGQPESWSGNPQQPVGSGFGGSDYDSTAGTSDPVGQFLEHHNMVSEASMGDQYYPEEQDIGGYPFLEGQYMTSENGSCTQVNQEYLFNHGFNSYRSYQSNEYYQSQGGYHGSVNNRSGFHFGDLSPMVYPDLEQVRKIHTLHSLLPNIYPKRLYNSLRGSKLDIVEEHTGKVFCRQVPKKMLVLFCGRANITKHLRSLDRNENLPHSSSRISQVLAMPPKVTNYIGFKVLLSWMHKACSPDFMGIMEPIVVPNNLFAAIALARVMDALGLHRDAGRVDNIIANTHLKRPLRSGEVRSIWKALPRDSKYTYRMVSELRERLSNAKETGNNKMLGEIDDLKEFMDAEEELTARIFDQEVNEQYKPVFSTDWCKNLPMEGEKTPAVYKSAPQVLVPKHARPKKHYSRGRKDSKVTRSVTSEDDEGAMDYATYAKQASLRKEALSEAPKLNAAVVLRIVPEKKVGVEEEAQVGSKQLEW